MSKKGQRQRRRLQASVPPSGQQPVMHLAPLDVEAMAEELVTYHGPRQTNVQNSRLTSRTCDKP